MKPERELLRIYAELFDYPVTDLAQTADRGARLSPAGSVPASALEQFAALARQQGTAGMQELYTYTFDLQPLCAPYLGYQLCGEDQRRGLFLVQLQQLYQRHGFTVGAELADHLAPVLRFLALAPDSPERQALVEDALTPVLAKMAAAFTDPEHPYGRLLAALHSCLDPSAALAADRNPEVAHG